MNGEEKSKTSLTSFGFRLLTTETHKDTSCTK